MGKRIPGNAQPSPGIRGIERVLVIGNVQTFRMLRLLLLVATSALWLWGNTETSTGGNTDGGDSVDAAGARGSGILPRANPAPPSRVPGSIPKPAQEPIEWTQLSRHSSVFLGLMHGFRIATEPGTREGLKGPFFKDYLNAVGSMHGWSDGDPFLVNYIGHPMEGAVASYLLIQHDPKFRSVQFGRSRAYWKSRLRGMGYAWAFSTQFEIGPVSEASIGNIQAKYPAYGFVDHVITPTVGTGWVILEDVLDKYVIRAVERRTDAVWLRILARGTLNPSRSMSNMMSFRLPWRRDDRPTIYWDHEAERRFLASRQGPELIAEEPRPKIPTAEFTVQPNVLWYNAGRAKSTVCIGGGALGQWNVSREWSLVADVGGCKLMGLGEHRSGDSLTYLFGPRWNGRKWRRFTPHMKILVGGNKVTEEELLPDRVRELEDQDAAWRRNEYHSIRANTFDRNAFALMTGGGLDLNLHPAVSIQLANFDYLYTGLGEFRGRKFSHNVRFTAGLALRFGTW